MLPHAGLEVAVLIGHNGAHHCHILVALFTDNVHCVIECDDSDDTILSVNNWQSRQVVLGEKVRNDLLVIVSAYAYHSAVHDILDNGVFVRNN